MTDRSGATQTGNGADPMIRPKLPPLERPEELGEKAIIKLPTQFKGMLGE